MTVMVVEDVAFAEWPNSPGVTAAFILSKDVGPRKVDADVLDEMWNQDVYQLGGIDLTDKVVIDVGAHMGAFTVLAGKLGAGVIAIEPDTVNVDRLKKHAALNGVTVNVIRAAAAAEAGDAAIWRNPDTGMAHVMGDGDPGLWVPSVQLSKLVVDAEEVELLKVDIEGDEYEVFGAMTDDDLARVRHITIETHPMSGMSVGLLIEKLLRTHSVRAFGYPQFGGMIHATRY